MKKYFLLALIASFTILFSCKSFRFTTTKSPSSYYVDYYINDSVNQYFIKPILYKTNKARLLIDFTFRDTTINCDIASNYSIICHEKVINIDSAYFYHNTTKNLLKRPKKMFIDKHKKNYIIRYSNILNFDDLDSITKNKAPIIVYYNNKKHIFEPTRKTKKLLSAVNSDIIEIIRLNNEN